MAVAKQAGQGQMLKAARAASPKVVLRPGATGGVWEPAVSLALIVEASASPERSNATHLDWD